MFVVFAALLGSEPDPSVDETEVQRLVRAARTGQPRAARRLYSLHVDRVYRSVRPLCVSDADAEDAVQETFARALQHLSEYQYRPESRFVAWLGTIALNVVRKRGRAHQRLAPLSEHTAAQERGEQAHDPEAAALKAEARQALLAALGEMPERERQVLTLRYGAGLTAPEVAHAAGVSAANVRKICERQRKLLLERLGPWLNEQEVGLGDDGR